MRKLEALQILQSAGKKILNLPDIQKLLHTNRDNTAYKLVQRLVDSHVLERVRKGYYVLPSNPPSPFELANALYRPSYVSLESALAYYGILIQAPHSITSVTPALTKTIRVNTRMFLYAHLDPKYFTDYHTVDDCLMATPEKALIDSLFFGALGRISLSVEELQLDSVDRKKVHRLAKAVSNRAFQKLFRSLSL